MYPLRILEQAKNSTLRSQPVLTCLMMRSIRLLRKQLNSRLQDKKRKEAIDAKNEADAMVFTDRDKLWMKLATRSMLTTRQQVQADLECIERLSIAGSWQKNVTDAQVEETQGWKREINEQCTEVIC